MPEFVRLLDRCLSSEARLIEVAKTKQVAGEIGEQGDPGVLEGKRQVERAVRRIKSGKRLFHVGARSQELAQIEAGRPAEPVAHHGDRHVCAVLAPLQQVGGDLSR